MEKKKLRTLRYGDKTSVDFEEERRSVTVCRILGSLVWPSPAGPGYYCILGQDERLLGKKKPLHFLTEFESSELDELLENLIDDARQLMCWEFFTPADILEDYRRLFLRFIEARAVDIRLYRAGATWMVGLEMIREWDKDEALLNLKGSTLAKQLGGMTRESLQETARPNFYAVDALRSVMDEFERVPWQGELPPSTMDPRAWS